LFDESRVFASHHFLGKNRFGKSFAFGSANGPVDRAGTAPHIRNVQIDVPETLSIQGRAASTTRNGATGT